MGGGSCNVSYALPWSMKDDAVKLDKSMQKAGSVSYKFSDFHALLRTLLNKITETYLDYINTAGLYRQIMFIEFHTISQRLLKQEN